MPVPPFYTRWVSLNPFDDVESIARCLDNPAHTPEERASLDAFLRRAVRMPPDQRKELARLLAAASAGPITRGDFSVWLGILGWRWSLKTEPVDTGSPVPIESHFNADWSCFRYGPPDRAGAAPSLDLCSIGFARDVPAPTDLAGIVAMPGPAPSHRVLEQVISALAQFDPHVLVSHDADSVLVRLQTA